MSDKVQSKAKASFAYTIQTHCKYLKDELIENLKIKESEFYKLYKIILLEWLIFKKIILLNCYKTRYGYVDNYIITAEI